MLSLEGRDYGDMVIIIFSFLYQKLFTNSSKKNVMIGKESPATQSARQRDNHVFQTSFWCLITVNCKHHNFYRRLQFPLFFFSFFFPFDR